MAWWGRVTSSPESRQPLQVVRRTPEDEEPVELRQAAELHLAKTGDDLEPAEDRLDAGTAATSASAAFTDCGFHK